MLKQREEGIEQGRAEGLAEGEASKALEMAKAMKSENIDIETIIKVSGLPKEEIEQIVTALVRVFLHRGLSAVN